MTRSTAFGLYDGHVAGVIERCTDHLSEPHPVLPREIFHIIRAGHIILATGAPVSYTHLTLPTNDQV